MIIQIRGTSGSGKSTVMKTIMDRMGDWQAVSQPGRKKPMYYYSVGEWPSTAILGHYESPCGGCDTIGATPKIIDTMKRVVLGRPNPIVLLCEGLLLSEDVKWSSQLKDLHVFFLTTPLEKCLAQIKARREKVGNEKELNPENTANRFKVIERARTKLVAAGIDCRRCSASQCPDLVLNLIRSASHVDRR